MCGFYAGEFAIECKAASDLISRSTITTTIRGATLMSKISTGDNILKVAVSSNDDIDDDDPVTIVRIVLPPSQQAVPEFTIKTALINEGAIATEYDHGGLVNLLSPAVEPLTAQASVRVVNNLLTIRPAGSDPVVLTMWDLNGRKIARHTVTGHQTTFDLSRYGRGAYLFKLQDGAKVTCGRFMLIKR